MTDLKEVSSLTEMTQKEWKSKDRHGKLVTMPQRRRKNNWQGVSGNPKGKPKGALHKTTVLKEMIKYDLIVSPSLLRRSEAVLENIVSRAEKQGTEDQPLTEEEKAQKTVAEDMIVKYILTPFIKMQAIKTSGVKQSQTPTVNINITKAEGFSINKDEAVDSVNGN